MAGLHYDEQGLDFGEARDELKAECIIIIAFR
jgi:hypothetical protein